MPGTDFRRLGGTPLELLLERVEYPYPALALVAAERAERMTWWKPRWSFCVAQGWKQNVSRSCGASIDRNPYGLHQVFWTHPSTRQYHP